jgi:hypothetical protein
MKWRDLRGEQGKGARLGKPQARPRAGVRVPIVATKPGNAGGAKGNRKVETRRWDRTEEHRRQFRGHQPWIDVSERSSQSA